MVNDLNQIYFDPAYILCVAKTDIMRDDGRLRFAQPFLHSA